MPPPDGEPPPPDVKFLTWTINGQPVPPGSYSVPRSTIIDALYEQHLPNLPGVPPGSFAQAWELSAIRVHYRGPRRFIRWHVVCHPGAVIKRPEAFKKSQHCTLDGAIVPRSTVFRAFRSRPRVFDVLTRWRLQRSVTYVKRINWFHVGQVTAEEVLFDFSGMPRDRVELEACISVVDEGTGKAGAACTKEDERLNLAIVRMREGRPGLN